MNFDSLYDVVGNIEPIPHLSCYLKCQMEFKNQGMFLTFDCSDYTIVSRKEMPNFSKLKLLVVCNYSCPNYLLI